MRLQPLHETTVTAAANLRDVDSFCASLHKLPSEEYPLRLSGFHNSVAFGGP